MGGSLDQHLWKQREGSRMKQREKMGCDVVSEKTSAEELSVGAQELAWLCTQVGAKG